MSDLNNSSKHMDQRAPKPDSQDNDIPREESLPSGMDANAVEAGRGVARRVVLKILGRFLGAAGIAGMVEGIGGGVSAAAKWVAGKEGHDAEKKVDEEVEKILSDVEQNSDGLSEREKAIKAIDYAGTLLFAWGVRALLPGGHGHIHAAHYGALATLTAMKYQLSDDKGKEHLRGETASNAKAFGIIGGTIIIAEGLNADVEKAYEAEMKKKPSKHDQVALMTMLSSVLSPAATTVGSASILKNMSNELCDGDTEMMAVATSHISNLSGYLLFGDPPFIAVCEKYGFAEGVIWQLKTMLPLALYSLYTATYKLNYALLKKGGLQNKSELNNKANQLSIEGLKNNAPILATMIWRSVLNIGRYFGLRKQDERGIQVSIGDILAEKIANVAKLPFSPKFDHPTHEAHEGMIREDNPRLEGADELMKGLLKEFAEKKRTGAESHGESTPGSEIQADERDEKLLLLNAAVAEQDYDEIVRLGGELGIKDIQDFAKVLRDFADNNKTDESKGDDLKVDKYTIKSLLNPVAMYDRATDVNRMKEALGHNLADVTNVFPFQAGCVPFLTPVFKDLVKLLERMDEQYKEIIIFIMIMTFSMFADNFVACKIGLELLPNKPHIPLIAAIQGGSMTAIGNMANVAQFSLDKFPLGESIRKMWVHVDDVAIGLAYTQAINLLNKVGIFTPPPVKGGRTKSMHAGNENVDPDKRRFLGLS